ncbi:MAG: glucosamine-6-phosphate deaminase [Verrucomicrobia bacterium]|nr:glucosamine-6-phosphate deaminase [Verrucomicrobiota bacterium]
MNTASPSRTFHAGALEVRIYTHTADMARAAAAAAAAHLRECLSRQGGAAVVFAAANSQVAFLEALGGEAGVDWSRVTCFHMDEYLGIAADHPASFRRFLRERVEKRVRPAAFHYIAGDCLEPLAECARYGALLGAQPVDLCCLGIGENGHIAFNDPPVADFADGRVIKLVKLERECRQQQVGEGHFPSLEAVPAYAFTLTVPALCAARRMVCVVPDERKARAVRAALLEPISPECPASHLRTQGQCTLFLDGASASLLA